MLKQRTALRYQRAPRIKENLNRNWTANKNVFYIQDINRAGLENIWNEFPKAKKDSMVHTAPVGIYIYNQEFSTAFGYTVLNFDEKKVVQIFISLLL